MVNATPKSEHYKNNNRQKAILTGLSIFQGEEVAAHLGHQACRWPLRDVASHVRVKQLLIWTCIVPFWFKSGLYSSF